MRWNLIHSCQYFIDELLLEVNARGKEVNQSYYLSQVFKVSRWGERLLYVAHGSPQHSDELDAFQADYNHVKGGWEGDEEFCSR